MNWRKWNNILHRDIGYISVGLIIIYSISGIAVNHISEWNPNYIIEKHIRFITPLTDSTLSSEQIIKKITNELNIHDSIKSFFRRDKNRLDIFLDSKTISAELPTGKVNIEIVRNRTIIKETNFLHLNNPKRAWTYVADLFAIALIFLAVSGLFVLKGKNGFSGRGKWLMLIGFLIPIIFLIIYL